MQNGLVHFASTTLTQTLSRQRERGQEIGLLRQRPAGEGTRDWPSPTSGNGDEVGPLRLHPNTPQAVIRYGSVTGTLLSVVAVLLGAASGLGSRPTRRRSTFV